MRSGNTAALGVLDDEGGSAGDPERGSDVDG